MVPYANLGGDAPLAKIFTEKGLNFISILISIGAVCGLTTTVLVGLYVQVLTLLWTIYLGFLSSVGAVVNCFLSLQLLYFIMLICFVVFVYENLLVKTSRCLVPSSLRCEQF